MHNQNFSIAIKWLRAQPVNKVIISHEFLKPFSLKDKIKLLHIVMKTHYVFDAGRDGIVIVSHDNPHLKLHEHEGEIAGMHKNGDAFIMLAGTFKCLRGKQKIVHEWQRI